MIDHQSDRTSAAQWAQKLLARNEFVILDSETTGLGGADEICSIAIIDGQGRVLLDTLIKPTRAIPMDATAIHHITNERVADAPTFADIAPPLRELLSGETVVIYNSAFDVRMMEQSAAAHGLSYEIPIFAGEYKDAMEEYSQWCGEWSDYHGDYRWQKLPGGDHSALGDARACLAIIKRMAGVLNSSITVKAMDDELRGYAMHHSKFHKDGDYNVTHDSPLEDALSAFIADLVGSYSDRHGSMERERLAHDWFTAWRRDLGWRPIYEPQKKGEEVP
jgi:DNA polymerase III epsilon subunit-like protein